MLYIFMLAALLLSSFSQDRNKGFLGRVKTALKKGGASEGADSPNVGFLLAHPDDESMFFVPTLRILSRMFPKKSHKGPRLYFLYLTNGDSEGQGKVRENELQDLCKKHGYSCSVVDDPALKDGSLRWDPPTAAKHVRDFVERRNVAVLFTFDDRGVSGHPNHVGALASRELRRLTLFHLESFALFPKYTSVAAVALLMFRRYDLAKLRTCAVSPAPFEVLRRMWAHRSQFRLHVPLWALFSSYCFVNTYTVTTGQT